MRRSILRSAVLLLPILAGCAGPIPRADQPEEQDSVLGQFFEPAATGVIQGRVVWEGEVPPATETLVRALAFNPALHKNPARFTTPHVPRVHGQNGGVENAVIFLRGIDPRHSRPWDHPHVRVDFSDRRLTILQGDRAGSVGFVQRGSAIEIVNRDAEYHNLHGRGSAFFAQPLVQRNVVHTRRLADAGIVDLTCGAGYYWMHAHLFVADHPYFARTDADGRFVLDRVPAGSYELVCWLPSWHVHRRQFDPETGIVARLGWAPPAEQTRRVTVDAGQACEITFPWTQRAFAKH